MKKITTFPRFEKLSIDHAALLKSLVANYPPYSEFNFTNLFAWDTIGATQISRLDDGVAVLLLDHTTKKKFYTLIGVRNIGPIVKQLAEMNRQQGLNGSLRLVPQTVIDTLESYPGFTIREDRDNFDYILSVPYHAELVGPKNQSRRRLIKKFFNENGERLMIKHLDPANRKARADILRCMSQWILTSSKQPVKSEIECTAIERLLGAADRLPVEVLGFYLDDKICAFSIFEYLQNSMGIVHFEKCDLSLKGIAPYVRNQVAKKFLANGLRYINYEQDLGIEGLRKAKSMLHPDSFLKKYTIAIEPRA